jgi:hypothetical protein
MAVSTPVKYYDKDKCFICKSISQKYCVVDGVYGIDKKLTELIARYLEVNVLHGRICLSCERKLLAAHKKCNELRQLYMNSQNSVLTGQKRYVKRLSNSPSRNCEADESCAEIAFEIVQLSSLSSVSDKTRNDFVNILPTDIMPMDINVMPEDIESNITISTEASSLNMKGILLHSQFLYYIILYLYLVLIYCVFAYAYQKLSKY